MTDSVLERNRAICGFCQVLQRTNPGEWCNAHQDDVPGDAPNTAEVKRRSKIEEMRGEVDRTVQASRDAMHRGIDAKYNLLRVSERRWSIVRVASTATITFGIPDVVTFEQVTGPLTFEAALIELRRRRGL